MFVFVDFEASSLSDASYPIEVGWAFEDGRSEAHLIKPAPGWSDWDSAAEAIHGISRDQLIAAGRSHDAVARRMVEALSGHDILASAPSWDGKWLSRLLRASGLGRHTLRLSDSDAVHRQAAIDILSPVTAPDRLLLLVERALSEGEPRNPGVPPAHRALADAREEQERLAAVRRAAERLAAGRAD